MEPAPLLLELGAVVLGLAVLARVAGRLGIPAIPFYLLAGLAFGRGGLLPLPATAGFIQAGAEIGLLLLLFMLGLEYSAAELVGAVRTSGLPGGVDAALNFVPGFAAGLLLGWTPTAAALLGGVTFASSSGIAARLLEDLGRLANRETPAVLSLLVIEDLAMVVYLAVIGGFAGGALAWSRLASSALVLAAAIVVVAIALKVERRISRIVFSESDEALLLTIVGVTLVAAGAAASVRFSAAVAALLVGVVLSGPAAEAAKPLLRPLRDFFAALFFVFFGLSVNPARLFPALGVAAVLAAVTAATKHATGWYAARRVGIGPRGRMRAGTVLIARGEFSIIIAGLAGGAVSEPVAPVAAGYVFLLAAAGPVLTHLADPLSALWDRTRDRLARRTP